MKNSKNLISIIIILVVLGVGGYLIYKNNAQKSVSNEANIPLKTFPKATPSAWDVFQEYLGYLKNHDIEKVKTVVSENVLQFHPDCPMRQKANGLSCNELMDQTYNEGIKLKKADFINDWQDAKQIVLSTAISKQTATLPNTENYGQHHLFFTKDSSGNPKFLASYGIVTTFIYKDLSKATIKEKSDRVAKSFTDLDKDGLLDKYENCVSTKNEVASQYNYHCSTTSPTKRDSLGDGFWDGIRAFFGYK